MIKKIIILMFVCIIEINAMDSNDYYHCDTPPVLKRKLSEKFHTISPVRLKAIIEDMNKELSKDNRLPVDWESITKISYHVAESRNSDGDCDKQIKDLIKSFFGVRYLEA